MTINAYDFISDMPNSVKIGSGSAIIGCTGGSGGGDTAELINKRTDDKARPFDAGYNAVNAAPVTLTFAATNSALTNFKPAGTKLSSSLVVIFGAKGKGATLATLTVVEPRVASVDMTADGGIMSAAVSFQGHSADGTTDPNGWVFS